MEGRFPSDSAQACGPMVLAPPPAHRLLRQAGAREHTSQATPPCVAAHAARLTGPPLPSSAPDSPPMAYVWTQTTQRATHHQEGKALVALTVAVDKALAYGARPPETVCGLCGRYGAESGVALKQAAEIS